MGRSNRILGSIAVAMLLVAPAQAGPGEDCAKLAASPFEHGFAHHPQRIADPDRAIAVCAAALADDPASPDVAAWLGRAYAEAFQSVAALPYLERATAGAVRSARRFTPFICSTAAI